MRGGLSISFHTVCRQTLRIIGTRSESNTGRVVRLQPGLGDRLFSRPPNLTANNFEAPWPTDPIFVAWKLLIPFQEYIKNQETCSIFTVGFALSKSSHLHRTCLVTARKWMSMTVYNQKWYWFYVTTLSFYFWLFLRVESTLKLFE